MCGILGIAVNEMNTEVLKTLYDVFSAQANRGVEGGGISINNKDLYRFRSVSPYRIFSIYNFSVWKKIKVGDRVLFHHRRPTSSPNLPKHNHPIANNSGTMHLIHNGVIWNADTLYNELKTEFTFETEGTDKLRKCFTDSEVMVHLIDKYMKKGQDIVTAIKNMYEKVSGSYAIAINIKDDENIYLFSHSNPINISKDKFGNFYFSSEHHKSTDTEFVCELSEGEIGKLNRFGYEQLDKITQEPFQSKITNYGYGFNNSYDRFPYCEERIIETVNLGDKVERFIKKTRNEIKKQSNDISYSKLCLHIFSAIDKEFPNLDIENDGIRKAVREVLDKKF